MIAPNPGSAEAVALGCTCPVLDNAHGAGYMRRGTDAPVFIFSGACSLHTIDSIIAASAAFKAQAAPKSCSLCAPHGPCVGACE
jgi:hypothetical protein